MGTENAKPVKDRKATIIDISEKTGFSIATVSRALNNFPNVKESTRKKILEHAQSLNYVPNVAAKNLVKGKSKIIGLLLPDRSGIYNEFVTFLYRDLLKIGFNVIVYDSNNESSKQHFNVEQLLMQQVDGIVVSPIPGDYKILDRILPQRVPVILFNRFVKDYPVDHVLFDFRKGLSEAVDFLVSKGRRHFWQFTRQDVYFGFERRHSFQFALKVNGVPVDDQRTLPVEDSFESGYEQAKTLLANHPGEVDAVLCSSDFTALGALRAVIDAGLRVPEDVAIVGSYDSSLSSYANPRISTIHTDFKKMSAAVADRVLAVVGQGPTQPIHANLETHFVHRDTT